MAFQQRTATYKIDDDLLFACTRVRPTLQEMATVFTIKNARQRLKRPLTEDEKQHIRVLRRRLLATMKAVDAVLTTS